MQAYNLQYSSISIQYSHNMRTTITHSTFASKPIQNDLLRTESRLPDSLFADTVSTALMMGSWLTGSLAATDEVAPILMGSLSTISLVADAESTDLMGSRLRVSLVAGKESTALMESWLSV